MRIVSPVLGSQAGTGGGGGGSVQWGSLLRQDNRAGDGQAPHGLYISHKDVTPAWGLKSEERTLEDPADRAMAVYTAGTATLTLTFGDNSTDEKLFSPIVGGSWTPRTPEQMNTAAFTHTEWPAPDPNPVSATYDYGPLEVTSAKIGVAGNSDWFVALSGRSTSDAVNASARLSGTNNSRLTVNSPPHGTKADGKYEPSTNVGFRIVAKQGGTHMNGFLVTLKYDASASAGSPTFAYTTSGGDITGLDIGGNGTTRWSQIVNGINALAAPAKANFAVTAILGGDGSRNISSSSGTIVSFRLSGGTPSIGVGQNSGFSAGQVRVIRGGTRGGGGATAKYEGSTTAGFLTFSWFEPGTDGNGFTILRRAGSGPGVRAFYEDNGNTYEDLVVHGPQGSTAVERIELRNAVNAARDSSNRQLIVATTSSEAIGQLAGFFPATGQDDIVRTLSGGTGSAVTNPLTVTYDSTDNNVRITCLPTDTWADIIAAMIKLPEFQEGTDGASGNVWVSTGADTETVLTPSLPNQSFRYNFSGGVDAVAKDTLSVTDSFPNANPETLVVQNVYSDTTVAEIIAAYSGSKFTLSASTGDTSDTVPGTSVSATRLTGGRDAIPRQAPDVDIFGSADGPVSYRIRYHGSAAAAGQRSTLAELKAAWEDIGSGLGVSPEFTEAGAQSSRVSAVPTSPSGGDNYIPPSPIEAIVDPDYGDGPTIIVRYHPDEDSQQDVYDALAEQGEVDMIIVRGTNMTRSPEEPGTTRTCTFELK